MTTRIIQLTRMMVWAAKLSDPVECSDPDVAAQRSYALSAAKMVISEVKNSDTSPSLVVENFIQRMELYSTMCPNTSFMFSVAHDTVQAMYDAVFL